MQSEQKGEHGNRLKVKLFTENMKKGRRDFLFPSAPPQSIITQGGGSSCLHQSGCLPLQYSVSLIFRSLTVSKEKAQVKAREHQDHCV